MSTLKRFISPTLFVLVLAGTASAQNQTPIETPREAVGAAPLVTVAATGKRVRFVSPGTVVQLRLEVYNEAGQKLFDTELRGGNVLDWHLQDGAGERVAAGSYACVLTIKSLSGRLSQRMGLVRTTDNNAVVETAGTAQLSAVQQQTIGPVEGNGALRVLQESEAEAITAVTHDGTEGQLTSTKGALTFRTGDLFAGKDKEQMRITEDGRVGIGTDKPEAMLDVAGTIRAGTGVKFADGTTLDAANGKLSLRDAKGEQVLTPSAAGTGTQGRLAKWVETGGAGTLGDSVVTESAGQIGIGTTTPQFPLHVAHPTFGQLYVSGGTAADFLMYHTNAPANARWTGLRSQDGRGKISSFNDNGSYRLENILTWNNANGYVGLGASPQYPLHIASPTFGQLYVSGGTAADFLMYHTNAPADGRWTGLRSQDGRGKISSFADSGAYRVENILTWDNATGNVGIGTAPTAAKLHVSGAASISGNGTFGGTLTAGTVNFTGLRTVAIATSPNVIGGSSSNEVTNGVQGATIAGGGSDASPNRVTDRYSTVGGGLSNRAGDDAGNIADRQFATVGGGSGNTASGSYSTVGGGIGNTASGHASFVGGGTNNAASSANGDSTVSGGTGNTASGLYSTVGGGKDNTASGAWSTVPGGEYNAAGHYSFAAGRRAKALNQGSFVWADSTDADFSSTDFNQFLIRANRGVGINTNDPTATLHVAGTGLFTGNLTVNGTLSPTQGLTVDVNTLHVDAVNNRVGVGTTTPETTLHVAGTARASTVRATTTAGAGVPITVGEYYRDNAIIGWAKVLGTGSVNANESFGITVARDSAGVYTITLLSAPTNQSVPVAVAEVGAAPNSAAAARLVTVDQIDLTHFKVYITNGSFAAVDNDFVVMVTGR